MLDAAAIIARAEGIVGAEDSDPGVLANLRRLTASLARDFAMSAAGLARAEAILLRDAVNRIEGLKWLRAHPEIAAEPIEAPVFLMGLPRSGTTYFQYLFDRDPRFRLIRTWEASFPSPPPGLDAPSVERRRGEWRAMQAARARPDNFAAMHLYDDDGSDECHAFLEQSYGAAGLNNLFRVPGWFDFLLDGLDLEATYRIHERQLQLLQFRGERKPWALKYPNHVLAMDAILAVHPTARLVMTHRDPAQVVASIARMTAGLRGLCAATPPDPREVGRDMLAFIARHIERIMGFDAGPHGSRVVHVDYYALVDAPVREMRAIHRGLGIDTPDEVATAVGNWQAANPRHARGANAYTLAEFGLIEAEIRERFADYIRRFAIPREAEAVT